MERKLIDDYEALIGDLCARPSRQNRSLAIDLASIPENIRGYGHVKAKSVADAAKRRGTLLAMLKERAALTEAAE